MSEDDGAEVIEERDLGCHYDPEDPDKVRWNPSQHKLFLEIFKRIPKAREFSPCDCGLAAAIIPRSSVKPYHFVIEDSELFALARREIVPPFANYDGPDVVLILGERA